MIGRTLGPYEIVAKLGEGGMGEVYRARDAKLNRDVAIKVLPNAVAEDPERLARFEREAQVLASLNHTNIAQVYGLESRAIIMELVEGEDLSEMIAGSAGPEGPALRASGAAGLHASGAAGLQPLEPPGFSPAGSRWPMRSPSRARLRTPSKPLTNRAWSIGISSRPT